LELQPKLLSPVRRERPFAEYNYIHRRTVPEQNMNLEFCDAMAGNPHQCPTVPATVYYSNDDRNCRLCDVGLVGRWISLGCAISQVWSETYRRTRRITTVLQKVVFSGIYNSTLIMLEHLSNDMQFTCGLLFDGSFVEDQKLLNEGQELLGREWFVYCEGVLRRPVSREESTLQPQIQRDKHHM
jgi:hypothetical protein